ncbi:MAG: hypothetical protein RhofKO_36930 [Rhodothermales bacterium]
MLRSPAIHIILAGLLALLAVGCDSTVEPPSTFCVWDSSLPYQDETLPLCRSRTHLSVATHVRLNDAALDSLLRSYDLVLDYRSGVTGAQFIAHTLDEPGLQQRSRVDVQSHYTHTPQQATSNLGRDALVRYAAPLFVSPDTGNRLLLTDELAVSFDSPPTEAERTAFAQRHQLELAPGEPSSNGRTYRFTISRSSPRNVLDVANALHTLPGIRFAEPNFTHLIRQFGEPRS